MPDKKYSTRKSLPMYNSSGLFCRVSHSAKPSPSVFLTLSSASGTRCPVVDDRRMQAILTKIVFGCLPYQHPFFSFLCSHGDEQIAWPIDIDVEQS
jgi:hypothetical protein